MKNRTLIPAAALILGAALPVRAGSLDLDLVTLAVDPDRDQCRMTWGGNQALTLASPSGRLEFVDVEGATPARDLKTWRHFKEVLGDGTFLRVRVDYGADPGKPSYVRVIAHD